MKNAVLVVIFAFTSFVMANAQETKNQVKTYKTYCKVWFYHAGGVLSSKVGINIDYGQKQPSGIFSSHYELVDENDKRMTFNNDVEALNYMARLGWEYVERFPSEEDTYKYLMQKTVTCQEEVIEGIRVK